ncbi:MAG: hypothetical protein KDB23_30360, partial [Planctomycetales bacterium]|nr:hypothetical protein [Planctomycetales bacterium]
MEATDGPGRHGKAQTPSDSNGRPSSPPTVSKDSQDTTSLTERQTQLVKRNSSNATRQTQLNKRLDARPAGHDAQDSAQFRRTTNTSQ